jgi:hypothetical protein
MSSGRDKAADEMMMMWAREDYFNMGPQRSINGLFNQYKTKSKVEGRQSVPTLHRPDLTKWRKEHHWDDWCVARTEQELEQDRKVTRQRRERALNQLTLLTDSSIAALQDIITDRSAPPAVRVKAADLVLAKVIIQDSPSIREEAGTKPLNNLPSKEATEEEKLVWIAEHQA